MTDWLLFTDGSVHTQSKIGCGAALFTRSESQCLTLNELKTQIQTRKFTATASTQLELQTLLWALTDLLPNDCNSLTIYTDSQNILSLLQRRARFEANNYHSKRGHLLRNAALYQAFFKLHDSLRFNLVKVKGHPALAQRDHMDQIFNLVDRAARAACKRTIKSKSYTRIGIKTRDESSSLHDHTTQ
jgi:ribonuclease HI